MRSQPIVIIAIVSFMACSTVTPEGPRTSNVSANGGSDAQVDGADAAPIVSPGELQPLYLAFTFHLEEPALVADRTAFDRYVSAIRSTADLFHRNGAIATWEAAEIIEKSKTYGVNILKELETGGDAIGLHANGAGYVPTDKSYSTEKMEAELLKQRANIDALGVNVRHVSNICSSVDWVKAVQTAKFEAVTGVIEYCLKSLPDPGSASSCDGPQYCHIAYPYDLPDTISSWYAASGSNWTTPATSGTLVLPTANPVPCSAEVAGGAVSPTRCGYADDDVTTTLAQIEAAVGARKPDKVHSHVLVASFGQNPNAQVMQALLGEIKTRYVDTGKAKWVKVPDLIDMRKSQP
jgi:hypothetical protein